MTHDILTAQQRESPLTVELMRKLAEATKTEAVCRGCGGMGTHMTSQDAGNGKYRVVRVKCRACEAPP